MQQNHTLPVSIDEGHKSQAYFALGTPSRLVLFIHGFMGSAVDTWNDFPDFISTANEFKDADIIFYGYKSLRMQANNQALQLKNALQKMQQPLAAGILPPAMGLPERNYRQIIIVAHSLGSIITRKALLYAHREALPWVSTTRMVLFAPAHNGARAQALAIEAAGAFNGIIVFLARYKYPVLDDLAINSPTITNLKEETEKLLQENKGDFTKAFAVVWAEEEKVVDNQDFCGDPVPVLIPGKSHTGVCKPEKNQFEDPVHIVVKALQ